MRRAWLSHEELFVLIALKARRVMADSKKCREKPPPPSSKPPLLDCQKFIFRYKGMLPLQRVHVPEAIESDEE